MMNAVIPRTLEDIEALDSEVLTCAQVAKVLGMDRETIHAQAVMAPQFLGFPVIVAKKRVKIPKRPFVAFMKGGKNDNI